jgi:chemotaxis protein MotB
MRSRRSELMRIKADPSVVAADPPVALNDGVPQPMIHGVKRAMTVVPLIAAPLVLAACVSQSTYDALQQQYQQLQGQNQQLQTQNQQLQQQVAARQTQVSRLQNAMAYTVNSDLLFPPGGWQMSARGKDIIARMAGKLAPTQTAKLEIRGYTDNAPIGPALQRKGIASNQDLSQKRAEDVMQFLISQGVNPQLVSAQGFGDADPVASNSTAKGRAQNRRVVIAVAPSS